MQSRNDALGPRRLSTVGGHSLDERTARRGRLLSDGEVDGKAKRHGSREPATASTVRLPVCGTQPTAVNVATSVFG